MASIDAVLTDGAALSGGEAALTGGEAALTGGEAALTCEARVAMREGRSRLSMN